MDGREIEPRTVIWAVAEVSWQDPAGAPVCERATLEDTSRSGACIRLKAPIQIGSKIHVRWQREQFSAIARNCRRDGRDFLLGVQRDPANRPLSDAGKAISAALHAPEANPILPPSDKKQLPKAPRPAPIHHALADERNSMEPKTLLPKLWRRSPAEIASSKPKPTEVPVNKPSHPAPSVPTPKTDLLSYDDIYRASGILNPPSGYGIQKVVDMLNSDRLRDLSKDIKRASVLMALDAAGTSVDDLLQDATRRQRALDSYEAGRRQQLEAFESSKTQENAQIEAELEQVRAHYAERIQRNREQVQLEKDALRNWQMAMQHESQRIQEVMELCRKPAATAAAASAGSTNSQIAPKPTGESNS